MHGVITDRRGTTLKVVEGDAKDTTDKMKLK